MMDGTIKDKLILVTGAGSDSSIGAEICNKLANDGFTLVLVGRRKRALEETERQIFGNHIVYPFDLSKLDEVRSGLNRICREHGKLYGLVHSASYQGYSPLNRLNATQINNYFEVNLFAALLLTSEFAQLKNHVSPSSIVYIGSIAGRRGLKGRSLYSASKAALQSITESCASELAHKKIRVNCVAPALVESKRLDEQFSILGAGQKEKLILQQPLGFVPAKKISELVSYLMSQKASHMTGQSLFLDGGFSLA
jgi:NAD(P)-dependent dehydrogenase (short-subunit alcohol dehydrogenase family)